MNFEFENSVLKYYISLFQGFFGISLSFASKVLAKWWGVLKRKPHIISPGPEIASRKGHELSILSFSLEGHAQVH